MNVPISIRNHLAYFSQHGTPMLDSVPHRIYGSIGELCCTFKDHIGLRWIIEIVDAKRFPTVPKSTAYILLLLLVDSVTSLDSLNLHAFIGRERS